MTYLIMTKVGGLRVRINMDQASLYMPTQDSAGAVYDAGGTDIWMPVADGSPELIVHQVLEAPELLDEALEVESVSPSRGG